MSSVKLKARSCPLCGSDQGRRVFSDRNRREGLACAGTYLRCEMCDMIYLNPIPDFADMEFEDFDAVYSVGRSPVRVGRLGRLVRGGLARAAAIFDRSARYHSLPRWEGIRSDGQRRRILDVGCSNGSKLRGFAKRGWEVHGVDVLPSALEVAQRALPQGRFYLGHVEAVGLPAASFDAIRADAVLEHVEAPVRFLRNLKDLLRPEGLLFLYVPNGASFCMRFLKRRSINAWVPFHVNLFTPATIRACLSQAGLAAVAISHNTPTNWLLLTARQWLSILRGRDSFSIRLSPWAVGLAAPLLFPFATALDLAWLGEELVVTARKPASPQGAP